MKPLYKALLFAALLLCRVNAISQISPTIEWSKSIGGSGEDAANAIIRTADGGFLIAGYSLSNDGDVSGHHGALTTADAWVVKLSASGNIEWQRSLGGSAKDEFLSAYITPDGSYLLAGNTLSNDGDVTGNHGSQDIWLVKLSRQGNILWQKCYGGSGGETLKSFRPIDDGYAFIANSSSSNGDVTVFYGGITDIWVGKLDISYNLTWQKTFGGAQRDEGIDIAGVENGGLLIMAYNPSNPSNLGYWGPQLQTQYGIVKINASGAVVWATTNRGPFPMSVIKGENGRYFWTHYYQLGCSGPAGSHPTGSTAYYIDYDPSATSFGGYTLGRLDASCPPTAGSPVYSSRVPGANALYPLNYSDAVMALVTDDPALISPAGGNAVLVGMKTGSGNSWRRALGGSGREELRSVTALDEFQMIAAGFSESNNGDVSGNHGNFDAWVVKLGKANTIKGTVFVDYNSNGVKDANEPFTNNTLVETEKNGVKSSALTLNGAFSNRFDTGTYVTKAISNVTYYSVTPAQYSSTFNSYYNTDSFSFALQPVPGKRDYAVTLTTHSGLRPGFNLSQHIEYKNIGTDTIVNRLVKLVKDSRITFISATPAPVSVIGDTITWNIALLNPRMSGSIDVQLNVAPPPLVNIHDILTSTVTIDTAGDVKRSNNSATWRQTVVGSFDPNDKQESSGGEISGADFPDKTLSYTIRFQNTGNDTAFSVVVKDTLDAKLDWNSIEMISASHPYNFIIKNGNELIWTFDNILLADSNRNEPASHGYITYSIKPRSNLVVGDVISNSASIYFDFNLPVKTNTHQTFIRPIAVAQPAVSGIAGSYCSVQGVQQGKINNLPASGSGITVTAKLNGNNLAIAADSTFSFDVSALAAGAHVIEVTYTNGSDTKTSTNNFNVTAAVSPDVNVGANTTTVANLADPVIITATNAAGGGSTPLYTFAKDRGFTNLWQAEGASNVLNTTGASLQSGDNWIYVRMKTSAACYTTQFNIDSIKIVLQLPVPNQPVITGLKATYCSNEGAQKAKLTNYPAAGTGTTVTVKLDGTPLTLAMADTSFSFNPVTGNHVVEVTYANSAGTRTATANFTVNATVTPGFDLSATPVSTQPVVISVVNVKEGGVAPRFTFAIDRSFTNILQSEGSTATLTLNPSALKLGENKIYVQMRTSLSCYTQQTVIDSITITKFGAAGLMDPDYPNQTISVNPNPFRSRLLVHGINTAKVYTFTIHNQQGRKVFERRIAGVSSANIYLPVLPSGIYSLSIYDETKSKLIGTINIAKQ